MKATLGVMVVVLVWSLPIFAAVNMETVSVGNPGNAGELSGSAAGGYGPTMVVGGVDYVYRIGKYEVTAGQYAEFLNAVAKTDTYGLYNSQMGVVTGGVSDGCNIKRVGTVGNYTYSVAADWANRPVNLVSWGDAARFANWMSNGQPSGSQGPFTTEHGSYNLNGAISNEDLLKIARKPNSIWVIPSEDEWYKAAYHKNDGVTANYWDYPTGTDIDPSNLLVDPDLGNNATYNIDESPLTLGAPYWRTEVGDHENSESPYGTFDQGGNVAEWDEAVIYSYRQTRGGTFYSSIGPMRADDRSNYRDPAAESMNLGFRVALIPEPATVALLAGLGWLSLRRRAK